MFCPCEEPLSVGVNGVECVCVCVRACIYIRNLNIVFFKTMCNTGSVCVSYVCCVVCTWCCVCGVLCFALLCVYVCVCVCVCKCVRV